MKNIFIIGFKSSGKTTLGVEISKKLNCKFIDTDKLLLDKFNYDSINSLYNFLSKEKFRKEEAKIIIDLLKKDNKIKEFKDNFKEKELKIIISIIKKENIKENLNDNYKIISLGGGTIFNKYLKNNLKEYGVFIFIDTPLDTIKKRLSGIKSIYDDKDINDIYNKRVSQFKKIADFTIIP